MATKKKKVPFMYINGVALPTPKVGFSYTTSTMVDSGRNAKAQVVGNKIGRDQTKLDNLEWGYLDADTWEAVLKQFAKFKCTVRYYEPALGHWVTRYMYPGDRTYEPYKVDPTTGQPTGYINCKCNLVDMGYGG